MSECNNCKHLRVLLERGVEFLEEKSETITTLSRMVERLKLERADQHLQMNKLASKVMRSEIEAATLRRALDKAVEACNQLDEYQRDYAKQTRETGMPGNQYYSDKMMKIVDNARAVIDTFKEEEE